MNLAQIINPKTYRYNVAPPELPIYQPTGKEPWISVVPGVKKSQAEIDAAVAELVSKSVSAARDASAQLKSKVLHAIRLHPDGANAGQIRNTMGVSQTISPAIVALLDDESITRSGKPQLYVYHYVKG